MSAVHSSAPDRRARSLVQGDLTLAEADFGRIATMLQSSTGISMPDGKATLVYSRLAKRLRTLGMTSFGDYCDLVESAAGADERKHMFSALTTNVTSFFREAHHFETLRKTVLPPLLERARAGGRVRLWSAGCSRGHEPYSIAMEILSLMPDAPARDIRILASDIDEAVLDEGARGHYDEGALANVPRRERARFFSDLPAGDPRMFSVSDDLRKLVSFRIVNLVAPWPMRGGFDVIFCRNVAIYFGNATQTKLWTRFADLLPAGGHLFIGHSERLSAAAERRFAGAGITTYRKLAEDHR